MLFTLIFLKNKKIKLTQKYTFFEISFFNYHPLFNLTLKYPYLIKFCPSKASQNIFSNFFLSIPGLKRSE